MSLWAFPRKVATVIRNETGTVVWGFTKAGFIYGVERYAQHVVVGAKLDDVNAWLKIHKVLAKISVMLKFSRSSS